ncbi:unnamed protein product [Microthlaspi erraticum]|uniref:Cytochrome P450 n=1 Tax=Microthlaspi erraticum TaxID=1685480 RepID=A0A6D2JI03_9BRAS|nr:unnamed protein product [Microthlaspi erraticum]
MHRDHPQEPVNFRAIFAHELFGVALKQAFGKDVEPIYVKELGVTMSKDEIFKKQDDDCYLNFLMTEAKTLTMEQIAILVWETIIETADTALVTTEWAIYELAKHQHVQDCLCKEIKSLRGGENIKEEHLPRFLMSMESSMKPLGNTVRFLLFPFAILTKILKLEAIMSLQEVAINIYACNMDKNRWERPEEWWPERFLDDRYESSDLHKTMAFGAGKRVCAGALQVSLMAGIAIARLVQEFEWNLEMGKKRMWIHMA